MKFATSCFIDGLENKNVHCAMQERFYTKASGAIAPGSHDLRTSHERFWGLFQIWGPFLVIDLGKRASFTEFVPRETWNGADTMIFDFSIFVFDAINVIYSRIEIITKWNNIFFCFPCSPCFLRVINEWLTNERTVCYFPHVKKSRESMRNVRHANKKACKLTAVFATRWENCIQIHCDCCFGDDVWK